MQQFPNGTNREFYRDPSADAPLVANTAFDLEKILPLEAIRVHTKTDDVPSVTDFQLRLYRKAAFEEAQEYTGLLLFGQRTMTEDVNPPVFTYQSAHQGMKFKHTTQYAIAQNFVWYYGLVSRRPERIAVQPGTQIIQLPRQFDDFGMGCCNPCGGNSHAKIQYVAGFTCEEAIPAVMLLGALKYIAHVVENPGDLVVAQSGGGLKNSSVAIGDSANPAWASGAIEMWRTLKRDAI